MTQKILQGTASTKRKNKKYESNRGKEPYIPEILKVFHVCLYKDTQGKRCAFDDIRALEIHHIIPAKDKERYNIYCNLFN